MKSFKKAIAVLLIMAIAILPVSALGEAAIDALKKLMEAKPTDDVPAAVGYSIYNEVDSETSKDVLCLIVFKDDENMITLSGINGKGQYEIAMYSNLNLIQMLYYSYMISASYDSVQRKLSGDASLMILCTYGDNGVIIVTDSAKAREFKDTILEAIKALANQ